MPESDDIQGVAEAPSIEERLSRIKIPSPEKLNSRQRPECPWCGRPVEQWGFTCDRRCYRAWIEKILPRREAAGGDEWTAKTVDHPPLPESEQPWSR